MIVTAVSVKVQHSLERKSICIYLYIPLNLSHTDDYQIHHLMHRQEEKELEISVRLQYKNEHGINEYHFKADWQDEFIRG